MLVGEHRCIYLRIGTAVLLIFVAYLWAQSKQLGLADLMHFSCMVCTKHHTNVFYPVLGMDFTIPIRK